MINLILNKEKLSIQFQILGKKVIRETQSDSLNLVLLDHQLLRKNCALRTDIQNVKT